MRSLMLMVLFAGCSSDPNNDECVMLGSTARVFATSTLDNYVSGCSTDSDCVLLRPQLSCYTGCPRAISRMRESGAQSELSSVSGSVCGDSSCMFTEGCEAVHARCVVGSCRTASGSDGGTDGGARDGG